MWCCRVNSRGRSRGVQKCPVQQGAVVAIVNQIVGLAGHITFLRLVGDSDLDRIFGVVEVNHVDIKDQHSRARNEVSYNQGGEIGN